MENYKSKQLYLPGTAILVTRFFAEAGIAELIDYMPLKKYKENSTSAIVRKIQVIRGTITFKVKCAPRFDYARATHQTQVKDGELYFASINDGNARIRLIADIELQERDGDGYAEFTLGESEIAHIILESVEAADKTPDRNIEHYTRHTYRETINDWRKWYKGAKVVDASCLLMPLTHFIAPTEPRWISTMEAIGKTLKLDVLLYRYKNSTARFDGLDGEEGTFNLCSFWYIEALAKSGKVEEAAENFERMIGYANHLGLFSEELGKKGEHLGNFPQAFTHLAMISAALELNKQLARVR